MATLEEITTAISENAAGGVKSATVDGTSTTAIDIDDQIKAANYVGAQSAASQNAFGLRFTRLISGPRQ